MKKFFIGALVLLTLLVGNAFRKSYFTIEGQAHHSCGATWDRMNDLDRQLYDASVYDGFNLFADDGSALKLWRQTAGLLEDLDKRMPQCFTGQYVDYSPYSVIDMASLKEVVSCVDRQNFNTTYECRDLAAAQPGLTPPAPLPDPPNGASFVCRDGTLSYAQHSQGACSHHGGIEH